MGVNDLSFDLAYSFQICPPLGFHPLPFWDIQPPAIRGLLLCLRDLSLILLLHTLHSPHKHVDLLIESLYENSSIIASSEYDSKRSHSLNQHSSCPRWYCVVVTSCWHHWQIIHFGLTPDPSRHPPQLKLLGALGSNLAVRDFPRWTFLMPLMRLPYSRANRRSETHAKGRS